MKAGRISPKELNIPSSSVFDLMGVTASQVTRTSNIKDFKVDWSFKSWKLNPNLAIQSQPVWELIYNRKDLNKYQNASRFMRRFASLDLSVGTVQTENSDRRIGFAMKINLIDKKDPLMAKELYLGIDEQYKEQEKTLKQQLIELKNKLDTTTNILGRPNIRATIKSTEDQLMTINAQRRGEINSRAKIYVDENWNSSSLDIAAGKIYTYKTDSAGLLTSLRLNRSTGWAGWVNGSLGIGTKWLLSGLFRVSFYQEELNFQIKELDNGNVSSEKAVAKNKLYSMGLNLRYGGTVFTFFAEFFYETKAFKTALSALDDAFKAPSNFEVVKESVKWDVVHPNNISFGGDWRISQALILNYGMRFVFDKFWKFTTFTPVATVSCMMR
jgi:hypothetical protein